MRLGDEDGSGELHLVPLDRDKGLGLRGGVDLDGDGIVSGDEMVEICVKSDH